MLLEDIRSKDHVIDPQRDFDIRWTANSMYSASLDTVRIITLLSSSLVISFDIPPTDDHRYPAFHPSDVTPPRSSPESSEGDGESY